MLISERTEVVLCPRLSRRDFFYTSALATALAAFWPKAIFAAAASKNEDLLRRLTAEAERFLGERSTTTVKTSEGHYLELIEAALKETKQIPVPQLSSHPWGAAEDQIKAGAEGDRPITLYFVTMRPGAVLPLHNHEDHLSTLHVLSGSFKVVTFRSSSVLNQDGLFNLKKVEDRRVGSGENTRITTENCYHEITALEQATFVDVMTITGSRPGSDLIACAELYQDCVPI